MKVGVGDWGGCASVLSEGGISCSVVEGAGGAEAGLDRPINEENHDVVVSWADAWSVGLDGGAGSESTIGGGDISCSG